MHGPMMRTCVSGMAALSWDLIDELAMYRRVGPDLVGLPALKLEAYGPDRALAAIVDSGLTVGYLVFPITVHPSEPAASDEVRRLIAALDMAAELDAPLVYVTSGPSGRLSWEEAAQAYMDRMRPAIEHAAAVGVALAIENTQQVRCDLSFTHTVGDTMALARMAGVGVCLDLYCCWQERDLPATLRSGVELIHLVQVSDFRIGTSTFPNRWVPGDADLPIDRMLAEVVAAGYAGVIDLELIGPEVEAEGAEPALRRGLSWLDRMLQGDLARADIGPR